MQANKVVDVAGGVLKIRYRAEAGRHKVQKPKLPLVVYARGHIEVERKKNAWTKLDEQSMKLDVIRPLGLLYEYKLSNLFCAPRSAPRRFDLRHTPAPSNRFLYLPRSELGELC